MKTTTISAALLAAGVCFFPSPAAAQDEKGEPVIVGITLDGKKILVELDGKKVTATADGEGLPGSQIDEKGNLIIVKDREGNPVAHISRWNSGGTIYRIARSNKAAIGIELNPLGKGLADHLELDPSEVIYVTRAIEGRAAAKAGLRDHDVILEIDGESPVSEKVLTRVLSTKKPGDDMKVRVMRRGKESVFVIRCERARTDGTTGFTYNFQYPGVFDLSRANYYTTLESTLDSLDRFKKANVKKSAEEYRKQLEKAREALKKAQEALKADPRNPLRSLGYFYDPGAQTIARGRQLFDLVKKNRKNSNDVFFLDSYRSRSAGSKAKPTRNKTSTVEEKLEKLEKRFDRLERMLEKMLAKKKSDI